MVTYSSTTATYANDLTARSHVMSQRRVNTVLPEEFVILTPELLTDIDLLLHMYNRAGISDIVLAPMPFGTRADMYLSESPEECKIVLCDGRVFDDLVAQELIESAEDLRSRFDWSQTRVVIVRGNIYPPPITGEMPVSWDLQNLFDPQPFYRLYGPGTISLGTEDDIRNNMVYSEYIKYFSNGLRDLKNKFGPNYDTLSRITQIPFPITKSRSNVPDLSGVYPDLIYSDDLMIFVPHMWVKKIGSDFREIIANKGFAAHNDVGGTGIVLNIDNGKLKEHRNFMTEIINTWTDRYGWCCGMLTFPAGDLSHSCLDFTCVKTTKYKILKWGLDFIDNPEGLSQNKTFYESRLDMSKRQWMVNTEMIWMKYSKLTMSTPNILSSLTKWRDTV